MTGPYEIRLTEQDVEIVLNALAKLPLELSYNAFNSVRSQLDEQRRAEGSDETNVQPIAANGGNK